MKIELREEDHVYLVDGVEKRSASQMLIDAGVGQVMPQPGEPGYENMVNAKHRGRQIHQACAMLIMGQPFDPKQLADESLPYVQAFLEYWHAHGPGADFGVRSPEGDIWAETPLYCAELDFCTTPDFHTRFSVNDIKTTDRPSRTWGLQTAAQVLALGPTEDPRRRIIWLRPKLKRKYEILEDVHGDPRVYSAHDFYVVREAALGLYDGPAITAWKAMQNGRRSDRTGLQTDP